MAGNFEGIKKQRYGVEIELTGITRATAAKAVGKALGNSPTHHGGFYDRYDVKDDYNCTWKIMSDASIRCVNKNGNTASKLYSVEVVTPILEYGDMDKLQEVVRELRHAGGICNETTGIHIHIDFTPYNAQTLRNLVNIFASKEDMLYDALQVANNRERNYCKKIDRDFLEQLNRKKPRDLQTIKHLWYGDTQEYHDHYHKSRYRNLNLHSVFTNNNIEIRAANGTLHSGVLRSYIALVLAVSNQALTQKSASPRVTESSNPKYTFRTWLIRIGLNGEEYKNCRKHLLSHLEGNIAWKNPEQAVAQRERLKEERIARREQAVEPVSHSSEIVEITPDEIIETTTDDCDEEFEMSM